jgi:hypothetical protein
MIWPIILLGLAVTIMFCVGMTYALKGGRKGK